MTKQINRYILLCLGWFFLFLAIVGIPLPLLPTTPFLLLAALCFSKSSPKLHNKLLAHKILGPIVMDWEERGVIKTKTKWVASLTMLTLLSYPLIFILKNAYVQGTIIMIMLCVLLFIWSRPST